MGDSENVICFGEGGRDCGLFKMDRRERPNGSKKSRGMRRGEGVGLTEGLGETLLCPLLGNF